MSQLDKLVGGVGVVAVGPLEVTIAPLSTAEEISLDRQLRRAGAAAAGDNYTRCRPTLKAAEEFPADRLEMVREIARATIATADRDGRSPLSGPAFADFRFGPEGLAIELYARGRKATPGLTPEGLRAVLTDANADDVAGQLLAVIEGGDPKATR